MVKDNFAPYLLAGLVSLGGGLAGLTMAGDPPKKDTGAERFMRAATQVQGDHFLEAQVSPADDAFTYVFEFESGDVWICQGGADPKQDATIQVPKERVDRVIDALEAASKRAKARTK